METRGAFLKRPETFSGDIILFVSSKQRCSVSRNFAVILILLPLQDIKRPALKNERVGVLWMAFRARKVFRSYEKRTAGPVVQKPFDTNDR